jgi:hypothetical protein
MCMYFFTYMDNLLDTSDLPEIIRKIDTSGNIFYIVPGGETYDKRGVLVKTKIENCIDRDNNNTNNTNKSNKLAKELKKHKQKTLKTSIMAQKNSEWAEGVYEFTDKIMDKLISEGLIVEGNSKEDIMKKLFEGYEPGEKVPEMKKVKKKAKRSNKISGYTFFTKSNKENFRTEFDSLAEKPRYMSFISEKWKSLSEEEKGEWNKKAVEANEAAALAKASEGGKEEE